MKKVLVVVCVIVVVSIIGCSTNQSGQDVTVNKAISTKYHLLKAEDVDAILADNFIGRTGDNLFTWNKENHRKYLSNGFSKSDSIFSQIAEGNYVTTRFVRRFLNKGDTARVEIMHFKRFENGKIVEIWEYWDYMMAKKYMDQAEAKGKQEK